MANVVSQNMCDEEIEIVQPVESQEEVEETTENFQQNTQYVLEVEPVEEPKKKGKGKGKSSTLAAMKKKIMSHGFTKWLKTILIADTTLRVMKPWLKSITDESLKTKNQRLFLLGQTISQVMKQFFLHMKETGRSLTECSFGSFEEWCYGDGLSTMSGKLPEMVWDDDSTDTLFNLYSNCIMELRRREEEKSDTEDEEPTTPKRKTPFKASSSLPNMKNTSMSSMTAHTQDQPVDACTFNASESILCPPAPRKMVNDGTVLRRNILTRASSPSKNRKVVTFETESEEEDYHPGQLFNQKSQQKSVEEISDPEIEPPMKRAKKMKRVPSSESEEEDEEAFTSMVDSLARAHSLTPSTGKISQNILIKDGEGFISFTSPGERGSMIIKLEMYPFKDCLRLEKNQYWTKRIYSSLAVVCSKNSPAYKTAMKLREQLTQQVGETKGVKIEKRAPTGWKRF